MINLFYNYYFSQEDKRMAELDFCLDKIISNKYIDNIFILISNSDLLSFKLQNEKVKIYEINDRPTYKFMIEFIGSVTSNDDINIIINSDCYLEPSTTELLYKINSEEMWCMNKYDIIDENFNIKFHEASCSQDCWIFRGYPKDIQNIDFNFGTPGCDNRFAYESKMAKYILKNPSVDIKILHLHLSQVRTCPHSDWDKFRIQGAYEFVSPHNIF